MAKNTPFVLVGTRSVAAKCLLVAVAIFALAVGFIAPAAPAVAANPSDGFQAGNIISDANFYDGSAMTASQIQTFLNERVPRCTIGDPGRTAGTPIYGSTVAKFCLRNFVMDTSTRAANAYCGAYLGQKGETAARIIEKVSLACGISPRVLLITLEKEQSLVSDTWPTENQFNKATGYGCPDTGPNNSANCNSAYFGFYNQVYLAAWQFKVYKAKPNSFNFQKGDTETILWHPNRECGTSKVLIENDATAALYTYTPYRPNAAALAAGWGAGDSCSAYGNRNFFNFYKTWFGNPIISLDKKFVDLYQLLGASLGEIQTNAVTIEGGLRQELEKGTFYWSEQYGAVAVVNGIRTALDEGGGVASVGFPTRAEYALGAGWTQPFERADIFWTSATKGVIVRNGIDKFYRENGEAEAFGFPLENEHERPDGAFEQAFENGTLVWSSGNGTALVQGKILDAFKAQGSALAGFPLGKAVAVDGNGVSQEFTLGTVLASDRTAAFVVKNGMRTGFLNYGGSKVLGFPLENEHERADGAFEQAFENGTLVWSSGNGTALVQGKILDAFKSQGSALAGFPLGKAVAADGNGVSQEFTLGTVLASDRTAAFVVKNGMWTGFLNYGGSKVLGFPLENEHERPDGAFEQAFENGILVWSSGNGTALVQGKILDAFKSQGSSLAGFPLRKAVAVDGNGVSQEFTLGTVLASDRTAAFVVKNGMRTGFLNYGGSKVLGFPLENEYMRADGAYMQKFEKGTLIWQSGKGVSRL